MQRNWFSNFEPFETPMQYQGMEFKSVETFYQAMKCEKRDIETRRKIAGATPAQSKKLGRAVKMRPDWAEIKDAVMEYALRYKFATGTTWHTRLMQAKGEIVEWNYWGDRIWGATKRLPNGELDGENRLGKLLMKIRDS